MAAVSQGKGAGVQGLIAILRTVPVPVKLNHLGGAGLPTLLLILAVLLPLVLAFLSLPALLIRAGVVGNSIAGVNIGVPVLIDDHATSATGDSVRVSALVNNNALGKPNGRGEKKNCNKDGEKAFHGKLLLMG